MEWRVDGEVRLVGRKGVQILYSEIKALNLEENTALVGISTLIIRKASVVLVM